MDRSNFLQLRAALVLAICCVSSAQLVNLTTVVDGRTGTEGPSPFNTAKVGPFICTNYYTFDTVKTTCSVEDTEDAPENLLSTGLFVDAIGKSNLAALGGQIEGSCFFTYAFNRIYFVTTKTYPPAGTQRNALFVFDPATATSSIIQPPSGETGDQFNSQYQCDMGVLNRLPFLVLSSSSAASAAIVIPWGTRLYNLTRSDAGVHTWKIITPSAAFDHYAVWSEQASYAWLSASRQILMVTGQRSGCTESHLIHVDTGVVTPALTLATRLSILGTTNGLCTRYVGPGVDSDGDGLTDTAYMVASISYYWRYPEDLYTNSNITLVNYTVATRSVEMMPETVGFGVYLSVSSMSQMYEPFPDGRPGGKVYVKCLDLWEITLSQKPGNYENLRMLVNARDTQQYLAAMVSVGGRTKDRPILMTQHSNAILTVPNYNGTATAPLNWGYLQVALDGSGISSGFVHVQPGYRSYASRSTPIVYGDSIVVENGDELQFIPYGDLRPQGAWVYVDTPPKPVLPFRGNGLSGMKGYLFANQMTQCMGFMYSVLWADSTVKGKMSMSAHSWPGALYQVDLDLPPDEGSRTPIGPFGCSPSVTTVCEVMAIFCSPDDDELFVYVRNYMTPTAPWPWNLGSERLSLLSYRTNGIVGSWQFLTHFEMMSNIYRYLQDYYWFQPPAPVRLNATHVIAFQQANPLVQPTDIGAVLLNTTLGVAAPSQAIRLIPNGTCGYRKDYELYGYSNPSQPWNLHVGGTRCTTASGTWYIYTCGGCDSVWWTGNPNMQPPQTCYINMNNLSVAGVMDPVEDLKQSVGYRVFAFRNNTVGCWNNDIYVLWNRDGSTWALGNRALRPHRVRMFANGTLQSVTTVIAQPEPAALAHVSFVDSVATTSNLICWMLGMNAQATTSPRGGLYCLDVLNPNRQISLGTPTVPTNSYWTMRRVWSKNNRLWIEASAGSTDADLWTFPPRAPGVAQDLNVRLQPIAQIEARVNSLTYTPNASVAMYSDNYYLQTQSNGQTRIFDLVVTEFGRLWAAANTADGVELTASPLLFCDRVAMVSSLLRYNSTYGPGNPSTAITSPPANSTWNLTIPSAASLPRVYVNQPWISIELNHTNWDPFPGALITPEDIAQAGPVHFALMNISTMTPCGSFVTLSPALQYEGAVVTAAAMAVNGTLGRMVIPMVGTNARGRQGLFGLKVTAVDKSTGLPLRSIDMAVDYLCSPGISTDRDVTAGCSRTWGMEPWRNVVQDISRLPAVNGTGTLAQPTVIFHVDRPFAGRVELRFEVVDINSPGLADTPMSGAMAMRTFGTRQRGEANGLLDKNWPLEYFVPPISAGIHSFSRRCEWPFAQDGLGVCQRMLNSTVMYNSIKLDFFGNPYPDSSCSVRNWTTFMPDGDLGLLVTRASELCPEPEPLCFFVEFGYDPYGTGQPDCGCKRNLNYCLAEGICAAKGQTAGKEGVQGCKVCKPQIQSEGWTFDTGRRCDDGDLCTRNDTCFDNMCAGELLDCLSYGLTGDYRKNCEVCNGVGCSPDPDYIGAGGCIHNVNHTFSDGSRSCGCSINGTCYADGMSQPGNACMRCDVLVSTTAWSPSPPLPCDDGALCTYDDMCVSGVCTGTSYSCEIAGACMAGNSCDGRGGCVPSWQPKGFTCVNGSAATCLPEWTCTGQDGVCMPPSAPSIPRLTRGALVATTQDGTRLASAVEPSVWPSASYLSYAPVGFNVSCGTLTYRLGFITMSDGVQPECDIGLTDSGPTALAALPMPAPVPAAAALTPSVFGTASSPQLLLRSLDLSALDGQFIQPVLAITDLTGETSLVCPQPIAVSLRPPAAGSVVHINGAALAGSDDAAVEPHAVSTDALYFSWSGFVPSTLAGSYSGMLRYEYAIGSSAGSADVSQGFIAAGTGTSSTSTDPLQLPLSDGVYFITVRGWQRDGRYADAVSQRIILDRTPAVTAAPVVDSALTTFQGQPLSPMTVVYLAASALPNGLTASWSRAVDAQSGVRNYMVALGTAPGSSDVALPVTVASADDMFMYSATFASDASGEPLSFTVGQAYYVTVTTTSGSGAGTRNTVGVVLDPTPPTNVALRLGMFAGLTESGALFVPWSFTEDYGQSSAAVMWAGTSQWVQDLANATVLTGSEADMKVGRPLPMSGIPAAVATSDNELTSLPVYVCGYIVGGQGLPSETVCASTSLDLTAPSSVTVDVLGTGEQDVSTPLTPWMDPGTGSITEVVYSSGESLSVQWRPSTDADSGIASYAVRITTLGDTSDMNVLDVAVASPVGPGPVVVLPWADLGRDALSFNTAGSGLDLQAGWVYYVEVRVTNGAGLSSTSVTPGIILDWSPPMFAGSFLSFGPIFQSNSKWLSSINTVQATVAPASSAASGILHHLACLSTSGSENEGNIAACTSVEASAFTASQLSSLLFTSPSYLNISLTGLSLSVQQRYTLTMYAVSRSGMRSAAVSLTSLGIDPTPPDIVSLPMSVYWSSPSAGVTSAPQSSGYLSTVTGSVSLSVRGAADSVSGVSSYVVTLLASLKGFDSSIVLGSQVVLVQGSTTTARLATFNLNEQYTNDATILHGARLRASISVVNGAGLTTLWIDSRGVLVDNSEPTVRAVHWGLWPYQSMTATAATAAHSLRITLEGVAEPDSPLSMATITVSNAISGAVLYTRDSSGAVVHTLQAMPLFASMPPAGTQIVATVRLVNAAGLASSVSTLPLLVVRSAPLCARLALSLPALDDLPSVRRVFTAPTRITGNTSLVTVTYIEVEEGADIPAIPFILTGGDAFSPSLLQYTVGTSMGGSQGSGLVHRATAMVPAQASNASYEFSVLATSVTAGLPSYVTAVLTNAAGLSCTVRSAQWINLIRRGDLETAALSRAAESPLTVELAYSEASAASTGSPPTWLLPKPDAVSYLRISLRTSVFAPSVNLVTLAANLRTAARAFADRNATAEYDANRAAVRQTGLSAFIGLGRTRGACDARSCMWWPLHQWLAPLLASAPVGTSGRVVDLPPVLSTVVPVRLGESAALPWGKSYLTMVWDVNASTILPAFNLTSAGRSLLVATAANWSLNGTAPAVPPLPEVVSIQTLDAAGVPRMLQSPSTLFVSETNEPGVGLCRLQPALLDGTAMAMFCARHTDTVTVRWMPVVRDTVLDYRVRIVPWMGNASVGSPVVSMSITPTVSVGMRIGHTFTGLNLNSTINDLYAVELRGTSLSGIVSLPTYTVFRVCASAVLAPSWIAAVSSTDVERTVSGNATWRARLVAASAGQGTAMPSLLSELSPTVTVDAFTSTVPVLDLPPARAVGTVRVALPWPLPAGLVAQVGLGTRPGQADAVPFAVAIPQESVLANITEGRVAVVEVRLPVPVRHGLVLWPILRVVDAAGNTAAVTATNPVYSVGLSYDTQAAAVTLALGSDSQTACAGVRGSAALPTAVQLSTVALCWSALSSAFLQPLGASVDLTIWTVPGDSSEEPQVVASRAVPSSLLSFTFTGLSLSQGRLYSASMGVQIGNKNSSAEVQGTATVYSRISVLADASVPTLSTIRVPLAVSVPSYRVAWSEGTAPSGIHSYSVGLSSCPAACTSTAAPSGAVMVQPLTPVGKATSYFVSSLASTTSACPTNSSLVGRLYPVVAARSAAGVVAYSCPGEAYTVVDTNKPAGGAVLFSSCAQARYVEQGTEDASSVQASAVVGAAAACVVWKDVSVPVRGLASIEIALGSSTCAQDLVSFRPASSSLAVLRGMTGANAALLSLRGSGAAALPAAALQSLANGTAAAVYATLRFTAASGTQHVLCGSSSASVDLVLPTPPSGVSHGALQSGAVAGVQASLTVLRTASFDTLSCHWSAGSDNSGSVVYRAALGTSPGSSDVSGGFWVSSAAGGTDRTMTYTEEGLAARLGETPVYCAVQVEDQAGNTAVRVSPVLHVKRTAPSSARALVRHGADATLPIKASVDADTVTFNFEGFQETILAYSDFPLTVEAALGTSVGSTVLRDWTPVDAPVGQITNLSLQDGTRVYVAVRAVDASGLRSVAVATASALLIDATPPAIVPGYASLLSDALVHMSGVDDMDSPSSRLPVPRDWAAVSSTLPPIATLGNPWGSVVSTDGGLTCAVPTAGVVYLPSTVVGTEEGASLTPVVRGLAGVCAAGRYFDAALSLCVPCEAGTVKPVPGNSACTACRGANVTAVQSSHRCRCDLPGHVYHDTQGCVCAPGHIAIGSECRPCPPGFIGSSVESSAQCVPCPSGMSSAEGATQCFSEDKSTVGTASRYGDVAPSCSSGYQLSSDGSSCVACTGNRAGLACQLCPTGTMASQDKKACTPAFANPAVPAGSAFDEAAWSLVCPAGTSYSIYNLRPMCLPCSGTSVRYSPQQLSLPSMPISARVELNSAGRAVAQCTACPGLPAGKAMGTYFSSSRPVLYLNWSGLFTGITPGVDTFSVMVGTALGGAQVVPAVAVGSRTSFSLTLPPTTPLGLALFATISVTDGFGRSSSYAVPNPVSLDTTPPLPGRALDGSPDYLAKGGVLQMPAVPDPEAQRVLDAIEGSTQGTTLDTLTWQDSPGFVYLDGVNDFEYWGSGDTFNVTWEPFIDPGSPIVSVAVCLGTSPGLCNVQGRVPAPVRSTVTLLTLTGLNLVHGTRYYATIFAVNAAGLVSSVSTNGAVAVLFGPAAGVLADGPIGASMVPRDTDCALVGAPLTLSWAGFTSLVPFSSFSVGWGTQPGAFDVAALTDVGMTATATLQPPTDSWVHLPGLQPGTVVYGTVVASATNGLNVSASSDGVMLLCPKSAGGNTLTSVLRDSALSTSVQEVMAQVCGWTDSAATNSTPDRAQVRISATAVSDGMAGIEMLCYM